MKTLTLPADMKKLSATVQTGIGIPFWVKLVAEGAAMVVIFAFILLSWIVLETPYPGEVEQCRGGQYGTSTR